MNILTFFMHTKYNFLKIEYRIYNIMILFFFFIYRRIISTNKNSLNYDVLCSNLSEGVT